MAKKDHLEKAAVVAKAAIVAGSVTLYCVDRRFRRQINDSLKKAQEAARSASKPGVSPNAASAGAVAGETGPSTTAGTYGVVYLLKAGPFYKIGKTTDIKKRLQHIKLQLPYSVSLIHSIYTHDISRVETDWHRRFVHQRTNGEWFTLSDSEVMQFCAQSQM